MTQATGETTRGRTWTVVGLIVASIAIPAAAVIAARYPLVTAVVAAGIGLVAALTLALTNFELFTLIMVAARTAIDISYATDTDQGLRLSMLVTGAYVVAAVVWLLTRQLERPLRISFVTGTATVVAFAALLSAALSTDREQALLGAARWVFLVVFLVALENLITDQKSVRRLLIAVGISTIVPLTLGTQQLISESGRLIDGISRVEGSFAHPNTYGFYLAMIGIGLIAILKHVPRKWRVICTILLAAVLVNLVATYSRTSYVAFAVGLLVVTILSRRWLLLAVTVVAVAAMPLIPGVAERFTDIGADRTLRGTPGDSLAWRIEYWGDVVAAGEGRRATGLGFGVVSDTTAQGREPHNDLLRAYVELGVIGLAAYLLFLVALGWQIRRSLAGATPAAGPAGFPHALAAGYAGIFAAYVVGSLTSNLMTQLVLLWYVAALAVASGLPARAKSLTLAEPSRA